MNRWIATPIIALALIATSCGDDDGLAADLGGGTTRQDASRNSFALPAPALTNEQRRLFERGDSFFTQNWVTAPASTDARDGLGPTFNAPACSSCHVLDGRGIPPDEDDTTVETGLLLRLSVPGADPSTGAPVAEPTYGGQLQDRSILGVPAEGRVEVGYELIEGTYADGTAYELRSPRYEIHDLTHGDLDPNTLVGARLAPQIIGMGLLEAIPEDDLRAAADPDDEDGDGISGRVNVVWDTRTSMPGIGRFGWKANVATVEQQVAGAFLGDIGITSGLHPAQNCPEAQQLCARAPGGGSPELTDERLDAVTFYSRTLSVPAMRDVDDELVIAGSRHFDDFGCSSCHTRTQRSATTDIDALSGQVFHPFTDLLLHDLGDGLADRRPDFAAGGSEWRTAPLWGIGLIEAVNGARFLLHDGRARSIEEAILWHGGEAEASKEAFRTADAESRAALVAFVEAL